MSALLEDRPQTVLHSGEVDDSPPAGIDQEKLRFTFSQLFFSASVLLVWGLVYLLFLSGLEQGHVQEELYSRLRSEVAEGTAPVAAPIAPDSPVALLSIPQVGVDNLVVVEGSRPTQLQDGPGHVLGSVLPGQVGVSVVAGRSLSFGAPFGRISELRRGARLRVTTGQGTFVYAVTGVRRPGDPRPAPLADGAARLTLLTAARGSGTGGLQATQTVYVDAELAQGAAPAGAVAAVDDAARPMEIGTDTTTLALLALGLQLLVLALVGFAWAWSRWSRSAAWIAGGPCVLAALWLVSSIGSRLLPGLV
jgi:sortase A